MGAQAPSRVVTGYCRRRQRPPSADAYRYRQPRWGTRDGDDIQPEPVIHRHRGGLEAGDDRASSAAAVGAADRDRAGRDCRASS